MFRIIHEDEDLLVVDKDSGILVIPDRYKTDEANVYTELSKTYPDISTAHRIDRDTSGLVVFLKTLRARQSLSFQFENHLVKKEYLALVWGRPVDFVARESLKPDGDHLHRTTVGGKHSLDAETEFEVIERFYRHSFVRAKPTTGRTHQIRIHSAHHGYPLIGDSMYGGKNLYLSALKKSYKQKDGETENPLLTRLALHAAKIGFSHPVTAEETIFESNLPNELEKALKTLRKYL